MSTFWWVMIVWGVFDLGFLAGCAWVTTRRPQQKVLTIYVPYRAEQTVGITGTEDSGYYGRVSDA